MSGPPFFGPFVVLVLSMVRVRMEWRMLSAKRFPTEQIVAKLREAGKLQGQGMTIPQLCSL